MIEEIVVIGTELIKKRPLALMIIQSSDANHLLNKEMKACRANQFFQSEFQWERDSHLDYGSSWINCSHVKLAQTCHTQIQRGAWLTKECDCNMSKSCSASISETIWTVHVPLVLEPYSIHFWPGKLGIPQTLIFICIPRNFYLLLSTYALLVQSSWWGYWARRL